MPSSTRPPDINALMDHIRADSPNITFYPHELPPLEVRNQADPFMIIIYVNGVGVRRAPIDIASTLIVCSLNLLTKIKVDLNSLSTSYMFIHAFDN